MKDENNEIAQEGSGSVSWRDDQTKLLIEQYKEIKPLVEEGKLKTSKKMWETIREVMLQHNYDYSIQQLENKWKSLKRSYKTVIENKSKTGRGRKSCPYERELADILEKQDLIIPVCVLENSAENEEASSHNDRSRSTTPEIIVRVPRRDLQMTATLKELQKIRKVYTETSKKREEMEERKFLQNQEILDELKLKNRLLEQLIQKNNN